MDPARNVGGETKSPISGQGRGPKAARSEVSEAQRAESGGEVLQDRGTAYPSSPARGSGERCKLLQRVQGGAPVDKRFSCIPEAPVGLSCNLLGPNWGHGLHKSAYE